MTAARTVTATFNIQRFTLTVNPAGAGSGTVTSNDGLIICPGTCLATYDSGTVVTLTAAAASGSTFGGWSGGGGSGGGAWTGAVGAARSGAADLHVPQFPVDLGHQKCL